MGGRASYNGLVVEIAQENKRLSRQVVRGSETDESKRGNRREETSERRRTTNSRLKGLESEAATALTMMMNRTEARDSHNGIQ